MAILQKAYQNLKGAFKVLFGGTIAVGLVDSLKDVIKQKGGDAGVNFIKSLATGKGLGNEAVYGEILDRVNLKTKERDLLIKAIEQLRTGTEKQKQAADNFIILTAIGVPDEKTGKRPGEGIIHGFIHRISEFPNEAQQLQMIKDNIVHIGTDAETKKKISEIQKWAKTALTETGKFLEETGNDFLKASKRLDKKSKKALKEFKDRPLWKKILMN